MLTGTRRTILLGLPLLLLLLPGCHGSTETPGGANSTLTQEEKDVLPQKMRDDPNLSDADKKAYARDQMRIQVQSGQRRAPQGQPN